MIWNDMRHKARCFYEKDDAGSVARVFLSDGSSAVVLYRMARVFQRIGLGVIGWIIGDLNKFVNGCAIGRGARFGKGLVLMHPVGVVINSKVEGGENIVIESGVVIGAARNGYPVKVPRLGNNIFIGAGAKILGGITVGNNVTIGANAVVIKDVADNQTVVGIPAKPAGGQS